MLRPFMIGVVRGWLVAGLAVTAIACSSSPTQPPSTSATASIGAAAPQQPANGSQVSFSSQPITLVVQNGASTGSSSPTYTFEVATDAAFANKVQVKDGVAQGSGSQTSVTLDALAPSKDYFWHVRVQSSGTTGVFSAAAKFTLGADAPEPASPANGAVANGWLTLTANDVSRTAGTASFVYRFDIATDPNFNIIIVTGTVKETPNQTSFMPPAGNVPPPLVSTLFWRVTAINQTNGTTGAASATRNFTFNNTQQSRLAALEGINLWPGSQPPGTNGHAVLGDSWQVQNVVAFPSGVVHQTPTLDELRVFDLLDRGLDPQGAIDFLNSHAGYATNAASYPAVHVIGFDFEYMAFVDGQWDLVFKLE